MDAPAREAEAVVLTGAQMPTWSRLPAEGVGKTYPSGSNQAGGDGVRDAHNGSLTVPEDARTGVPVDQVVAYRWVGGETDGEFVEVPVQVDERFPHFLANARSNFGFYSGTDKELTYEWDVESWKKMFGDCSARYAETIAEVQAAIDAGDIGALGGSTLESMLAKMEDPVATLDDDDEVVFMASDAGARAPLSVGPPGTGAVRQEIAIIDPRDPANVRFIYLFLDEDGASFEEDNGYVAYQRDENADQWIDRSFYANTDPEKLGTSNTGYGPNLRGTVCDDAGTTRRSNDRFVRDGVTVTTDAYRWTASGRWMVRGMQVRKPGTDPERGYGQDLIDRWKGRAFQQSPDSQISVVGFEDEQVNWEGNSALIGELEGPVRAIRETWGADSGTNVTKTETFYRNAVHYRYRVRVHPIPPDGLYTSWDYNHDVAHTYFNESLHVNQTDPTATTPDGGVPIDGINDEIVGNVDGVVVNGENQFPAYFDAPDPTHTKPLAFFNWEQVSGKDDNGSLVYMFEMKNAQSLENPVVTPYYRDDACLDDGTGDNPSPRPMPGDSQESSYPEGTLCYTEAPEGYDGPYRQGCFGCHGVHYFFTHDTDNATFPGGGVTEIDGAQWQWAVPTEQPTNIGDRYANTVKTPLIAAAVPQPSEPQAQPTTLEIVGDVQGQITDVATLAARLTDEDGAVAGAGIDFTLRGEPVGSGTTDDEGVASIEVTLDPPAGETEQTASFLGDEESGSSSDRAPFTVQLEDSSMSLGVTEDEESFEATATLAEADTEDGLANREIRFSMDGEPIGTATTDENGRATASLPKGEPGSTHTIEAAFEGDDSFKGSSASEQVTTSQEDETPDGEETNPGNEGGNQPPTTSPSQTPDEEVTKDDAPGTATASLSVSRRRVRFNRPVVLEGRIETTGCDVAPATVTIQRRDHGSESFVSVADVEVQRDGSWSTTARSKVNASYVAAPDSTSDCSGTSSAPVDVLVKAAIDISTIEGNCGNGRVQGRVLPNHAGDKLILQQKSRGGFKQVGADRLNKRSAFALSLSNCRKAYRLVFKKQDVRNERVAAKFRF